MDGVLRLKTLRPAWVHRRKRLVLPWPGNPGVDLSLELPHHTWAEQLWLIQSRGFLKVEPT